MMTIFFVTYCNCLIFLVWILNQPGRWVTQKMSSSYQHHWEAPWCHGQICAVYSTGQPEPWNSTPAVIDSGRLTGTPLAGLSDTEVLSAHTWHVVGPQFSLVAQACLTVCDPLWWVIPSDPSRGAICLKLFQVSCPQLPWQLLPAYPHLISTRPAFLFSFHFCPFVLFLW